MRLRHLAMAACFILPASGIVAPAPASAAVEYSFYYGDGTDLYAVHFTYIAPSFITTQTKAEYKDFA